LNLAFLLTPLSRFAQVLSYVELGKGPSDLARAGYSVQDFNL
jgi:hypothetical protein